MESIIRDISLAESGQRKIDWVKTSAWQKAAREKSTGLKATCRS